MGAPQLIATNPIRQTRNRSITLELNREGILIPTIPVEFDIEFDRAHDAPSEFDVVNAPGVPIPGRTVYSPKPSYLLPFITFKNCTYTQHKDSKWLWTGKGSYAADVDSATEQTPVPESTDPLTITPIVESFVDTMEIVAYQDIAGDEVLNAAGQLFKNGITLKLPLAGVRITRYVPAYNENVLAGWLWRKNDATWRGGAAGSWVIRAVSGSEVKWRPGVTVGQLTFEMVKSPLSYKWSYRVIEQGSIYLVAAGSNETKAFMNSDATVNGMGWLSADGTKNETGTPVYKDFVQFLDADFSDIL